MAKLAALKLRQPNMAITFGNTIHLYNVSEEIFLKNNAWVCHELKHIEQFRRMGFAKFLGKYLFLSLKHGYYNNPLEAEARLAEKDISLLAMYKKKHLKTSTFDV